MGLSGERTSVLGVRHQPFEREGNIMNRNRRLSIAGATLAGLIGVTALTGAASASADTLTTTKVPVPTVSVPAKPAD
jgi:hypothetical protein